ncbi:MAG: hypothetical protein ACTSO6_14275 [Promethearchaeota archaeon]
MNPVAINNVPSPAVMNNLQMVLQGQSVVFVISTRPSGTITCSGLYSSKIIL